MQLKWGKGEEARGLRGGGKVGKELPTPVGAGSGHIGVAQAWEQAGRGTLHYCCNQPQNVSERMVIQVWEGNMRVDWICGGMIKGRGEI